MVAHNVHKYTCCVFCLLLLLFVENATYCRMRIDRSAGILWDLRGGGLTIPIKLDRAGRGVWAFLWGLGKVGMMCGLFLGVVVGERRRFRPGGENGDDDPHASEIEEELFGGGGVCGLVRGYLRYALSVHDEGGFDYNGEAKRIFSFSFRLMPQQG